MSLCYAVVVGAYGTYRGCQALLSGRRGGGERHDFGLTSELGVLLQQNLICGNEVGNLINNKGLEEMHGICCHELTKTLIMKPQKHLEFNW